MGTSPGRKPDHVAGTPPGDALPEDLALHFSLTVYHHTRTCLIGDVVDPRLRVTGVRKLREADASVMPNVTSGNTNAPSIMIAADNGVRLTAFAGEALAWRGPRLDLPPHPCQAVRL